MSERITLQQWMDEMSRQQAATRGGDGQTCAEIAKAAGLPVRIARARLREVLNAGRLRAGLGLRPDICGRAMKVPVYWITKAKR
jgi:hypothetical protein